MKTAAVDLAGAWSGLWGRISGASGVSGLITLMTWVGVGMVVFAVVKWAWSRRRGGAQAGQIGWPIFVGAMLAAPAAVVPAVLWVCDLGANALVNLLS
ncbi:hypothetical protein [Pengzhenrongella sp.]|jgi:hypothetical protein|uniref:hypothetical protein n=1 Tax=Pengzhenrongella sp. TaxID=2888820 RepID=UPI002F95FE83